MAQLWYYSDGKQVSGPITADELRKLAASGALRPEMHVCSEPDRRWALASTVQGLFAPGAAPEPQAPPVAHEPPASKNAASGAMQSPGQIQPGPVVHASHEPLDGVSGGAAPGHNALSRQGAGLVGGALDITFRRFATPKLVVVIWVLCLAAAAITFVLAIAYAGFLMFQAESVLQGVVGALTLIFTTLAGIAAGLLYARIILEAVMILFRIAEHLEQINAKTPRDRAEL